MNVALTHVIYCFTEQLSSPSVFPLVPCNDVGDEITVGCLAYNFFPDSLTFNWSPTSKDTQFPSVLKENKYSAVSLVRVPKTAWISGQTFGCTTNHSGIISPTTSIPFRITTTSAATPAVTVHVLPEEAINERPGEVTMVCLVSSPVHQNYNISWLEYTEQRTSNYISGADSSPVKTQGGYSISSVYSTTQKKWQTYTFECNVFSRGSSIILGRRAVSSAQFNAIECDRWLSGCCAIVSLSTLWCHRWLGRCKGKLLCEPVFVCHHSMF